MAKKAKDSSLELQLELLRNSRHDAQTYRIGIIIGQVAGGLAFLGGTVLALAGLSGNVEWLVTAVGFSSKLTNASPGVVFAIAGIVILWRYKPRMNDNIKFDGGHLLNYDTTKSMLVLPSDTPDPKEVAEVMSRMIER